MNLVLIHGSYLGAWYWERLTPELERLGQRVTAVDLPISERGVGASGYADAVIAGTDWSEPPVLVAHSMAGAVAPVVAARKSVRRMIFIGAFLPKPGVSIGDQRAAEPIDPPSPPATAEWTHLGGGLWSIGPNTARELFMQEATAEIADWVAARLRPQCYDVMTEITPLTAWPAVESDYIVCTDDHACNPVWGRQAARDRLGVEPLEIAGDHSPMLSRPHELAVILDAAARR
jgi:pimeloyl-ACP methyl ester carboxylesterase